MRDSPSSAAFKPRSPFPLRCSKGAGSEALRDAAPGLWSGWEAARASNERGLPRVPSEAQGGTPAFAPIPTIPNQPLSGAAEAKPERGCGSCPDPRSYSENNAIASAITIK